MQRSLPKVLVGGQQCEAVTNTKLRQQGINGADLQAVAPTVVSQFRSVNVILPVRHDKRKCGESIDEVFMCPWPGEPLQ